MPADDQQIPSVWARPRREREQPVLNRESIVAEAVRLLDEEGADNLSMRRLGSRLGAGATSLYRHVASKDELFELAVDEVYGELPLPDAGEWRATATEVARALRAVILRHPWMAAKLGEAGLAYLGPNMLRQSEYMLSVFETAGLSLEEADQAVSTVTAFVLGVSTSEAAWLSMVARSGQSAREWAERLWPAAERAVQDYPRLRALYAAQRGDDASKTGQDAFEYGLERVLDGLQSRLPEK
ncbi:regulatory protein, tetR family [Nonomuraea solani]|uniref:Regulatory protein, tetR family n=1 Tax=Nonomuraea solani TaxID=1144553 RepID=A0A1H5UPW6_9ACTN|nr:TetR/AcrR family transcriptional regulator [Nonomuraea solani]SEF77099.1 regulatory protein, tetR family [Nonomuraea solani]